MQRWTIQLLYNSPVLACVMAAICMHPDITHALFGDVSALQMCCMLCQSWYSKQLQPSQLTSRRLQHASCLQTPGAR
jgi:hypothetical protein